MSPINTQAIQQLRKSLSSTAVVLTPFSAGYKKSLERWASSAEKRPGLVVFPTTAEDVAKAIQFSVQNGLELAAGGSFHGFFSTTEGGMCMNLTKMNGVSVDAEAKTVTVQGGALWADVDAAAAKHDLAVVGGTVNFVGVGGLTLGGGYGYLSGAHGLAIDNLVSVELVLADGQIATASESENQDLFWAIRGAGSSFGIATKFVFRAHEQKSLVWSGTLRFTKSQLGSIIDFANKTMEISQGEATMMVGFSGSSIVTVLFYNGTEEAAKSFYAPLLALNPTFNDTAMVPYSTVNSWHNASVANGSRRTMKGSALLTPMSSSFVESLFEQYENLVENVEEASKSLVLFDFFSFKKIMEVPQTATAFANRGAFINVLFAPAWDSESNDASCREWTLDMAAKTEAELKKQKASSVDEMTMSAAGEYGNYDGFGNTSAEKLFGVNYKRLVSLKRRYDPLNVFAKGHNLLPGVQVARSVPEQVSNNTLTTLTRTVATSA